MSLLGLGSDNLIKVDCEASFRVDVEKMRRTAEICLEKNFKVCLNGAFGGWEDVVVELKMRGSLI